MKRYLLLGCCLILLPTIIILYAINRLASDTEAGSGASLDATPAASVITGGGELASGFDGARSAADEGEPLDDVHPLTPVLQLAKDIKARIQNDVRDYSAVLVKRERINGKLMPEERMELKVRNRRAGETDSGAGAAIDASESVPLSAYMKFLAPSSAKGREVIWVEGRNNNNIIVHEGGFKNLLRLTLAPDGMLAMRGNKYPITEIGLLRLAEKLIEKGERDRELGPCSVEIIEGQEVGDRKCRVIQVTHPEKKEGFDFHVAQIFVDDERQLPLRYAAFMWPEKPGDPPPLEEEYTYLDLKVNVGLTEADFDPENPEYNYP